jgi:predicted RNase H-like nuclease
LRRRKPRELARGASGVSKPGEEGRELSDDWRTELARLLDGAVARHGSDPVLAGLRSEIERLAPPTPSPLEVEAPVLGVDACPGGWVGVLLTAGGRPAALTSRSIAALVELARGSAAVAVVGIDIPIGLPDRGGRQADVLARAALPGKASSVFSAPTRAAYDADSYEEARARNVAATGGTSLSAQAWGLRAKVLDVDAWLRTRPGVEVIEVHPELSFARMVGAPISERKKDPEGVAARRTALERVGLVPPAWFRGSGFGEDDLLDACAAAWTAVRHTRGESESLPAEPEVFSDGLPAAIWV